LLWPSPEEIWVGSNMSSTVTKLRAATWDVGTYTFCDQPDALAFDGTNIWVADIGSNNVAMPQATGP
jgi:hypothetical protein